MHRIIVTFKKLDSSEALTQHTKEKLLSLYDLLSDETKIEVTYWEYEGKKVGDINLRDKGQDMFAKAHAEDFHKTLDQLKSKIRTQIIKHNEKIRG